MTFILICFVFGINYKKITKHFTVQFFLGRCKQNLMKTTRERIKNFFWKVETTLEWFWILLVVLYIFSLPISVPFLVWVSLADSPQQQVDQTSQLETSTTCQNTC